MPLAHFPLVGAAVALKGQCSGQVATGQGGSRALGTALTAVSAPGLPGACVRFETLSLTLGLLLKGCGFAGSSAKMRCWSWVWIKLLLYATALDKIRFFTDGISCSLVCVTPLPPPPPRESPRGSVLPTWVLEGGRVTGYEKGVGTRYQQSLPYIFYSFLFQLTKETCQLQEI